MYLSPSQQQIANKKRQNVIDHFLEGVRSCNECNGTGLEGVQTNPYGDSSWDGNSFCDKCKGIGFLKWKETLLQKLCPRCQGGGLAAGLRIRRHARGKNPPGPGSGLYCILSQK